MASRYLTPRHDHMHATLFEQLRRARSAPAADFPHACGTLVDRLETDFRYGEAMMEALCEGRLPLYREQHARVLGGLHHAVSQLQAGDTAPARRALEDLALWLPMHLAAMDAEMANAAAGC